MKKQRPLVGLGVFVFKNGKFLIGHRKGSHGTGTWAIPGGHHEFGDSFEDTVHNELAEENGVTVKNIRFGAITNDIFYEENKHYVTVWMTSEWESGTPKILEPHKCLEWRWVDFDSLPEPLFLTWQQLLKSEFVDEIKEKLEKSHI